MANGFETERLTIRELVDDDLEQILDVYVSNPEYLELTEGSGGEPGLYDLGMLQRDFATARMSPGRVLAGLFLKPTDEAVGVLDWMDENPSDDLPWIGLLMVRADRQREGLASEAFEGLAELLRARAAQTVRAAVVERNEAGRALARKLGFEPVETRTRQMASAERVTVVERTL
jgi:RimJ/RimL family protein N-acetyltransferase